MNWIVWAVLVTSAANFCVETGFMAVASAKRVIDAGAAPRDIKAVAYFWLVVGWPADVLFNWTRGSWEFKEFPRELTFSSRVQRHVRESSDWRLGRALHWANILNLIWPGHIEV